MNTHAQKIVVNEDDVAYAHEVQQTHSESKGSTVTDTSKDLHSNSYCGGNGDGCSVPAETYEVKPVCSPKTVLALGGGGAGVGRLPRPTSVRRWVIEAERVCRGWCGCCRGGGSDGGRFFGAGSEAEAEAEAADAKPAAFSASAAMWMRACGCLTGNPGALGVGLTVAMLLVWKVEENLLTGCLACSSCCWACS